MAYGKRFYRMYESYLREPVVRRNHDMIFKMFAEKAKGLLWVVDLGCGLSEYSTFDRHHRAYAGIDLNDTGKVPNLIKADYATLDFKERLPFSPNAFVSLFSIECCYPTEKKYTIYERLFRKIPSLQFGLAGGFFYESRKHQKKVKEASGLISYQTIEDPKLHASKLFKEHRFTMGTPSKMFGQDVIEVWKFLSRR